MFGKNQTIGKNISYPYVELFYLFLYKIKKEKCSATLH